jgi:hypothetical protein
MTIGNSVEMAGRMGPEEQRELAFIAALELPDRLDSVSAKLVRRDQADSP